MKFTPDPVTRLQKNQVFVFGSNLAGIHGGGAARTAHEKWGAEWGIGNGPTGRCFALPTKDERIETLPISRVRRYVEEFLLYAKTHPDQEFLVTKVGCGLAGYTIEEIAPLFQGVENIPNVVIPLEFDRVLSELTSEA